MKITIDEITRAAEKNNTYSLGYDDNITTDFDISIGTGVEDV